MPDLKVIIKEEIELNGYPQGGQFEKTYPDIENIYKSYGYIPLGAEQNFYTTTDSSWVGSSLENDGLRYVRITNLTGNGTGSEAAYPYYTQSANAAASASGGGNVMRIRTSGSQAGI